MATAEGVGWGLRSLKSPSFLSPLGHGVALTELLGNEARKGVAGGHVHTSVQGPSKDRCCADCIPPQPRSGLCGTQAREAPQLRGKMAKSLPHHLQPQ